MVSKTDCIQDVQYRSLANANTELVSQFPHTYFFPKSLSYFYLLDSVVRISAQKIAAVGSTVMYPFPLVVYPPTTTTPLIQNSVAASVQPDMELSRRFPAETWVRQSSYQSLPQTTSASKFAVCCINPMAYKCYRIYKTIRL